MKPPIVIIPDRPGVLCADPDFPAKLAQIGARQGRRWVVPSDALFQLLEDCQAISHRLPDGRRHILSKSPPPKFTGLGDIVHAIALPIARLLRLSCIDPRTGQLRPDSPCARRHKDWNSASMRFLLWLRRTLNHMLPFHRHASPPRPPRA